jgi:serine/threonine protein kinase
VILVCTGKGAGEQQHGQSQGFKLWSKFGGHQRCAKLLLKHVARLCRFFQRLEDYEEEHRMYEVAAVKPTLPQLYASSNNIDGIAQTLDGYVFPPFLVMERGMTLAEWITSPRSSLAVLSLFSDVARLLAQVHAANYVHRDLKPDNLLLMLQSQAWRLIDFGIAAPIGVLSKLHPQGHGYLSNWSFVGSDAQQDAAQRMENEHLIYELLGNVVHDGLHLHLNPMPHAIAAHKLMSHTCPKCPETV